MSTTFPTTLDTFVTLSSTDEMDDSGKEGDVVVNLIYGAVAALEAKVGADSSAVTTSFDYRVAALEAATIRRKQDLLGTSGAGVATFTTTNAITWFDIVYRNSGVTYAIFPDEYTVIDDYNVEITGAATGDYLFTYYTMEPGTIGSTTLSGGAGPPTVWNSADKSPNITLSNADLTATQSAGFNQWNPVRGTVGIDAATANDYFEVVLGLNTQDTIIGSGNASAGVAAGNYVGMDGNSMGFYPHTGEFQYAGSGTGSYPNTNTTGTVIGVLLKLGKIYFSVNGTMVNSGDPATQTGYLLSGITGTMYPMMSMYQSGNHNDLVATAVDLQFLPSGARAWGQ